MQEYKMFPLILVSDKKSADEFVDDFIKKEKFSSDRITKIYPQKKEIVLPQVKQIIRQLSISSKLHRLFIFYDFDTAGAEAQNALLKSLEEYSGNNQFILITKNEHSVFPTIRSRSKIQKINQNNSKRYINTEFENLLNVIENAENYSFMGNFNSKKIDSDYVLNFFDSALEIYRKKMTDDPRVLKIIKKILYLRALVINNNVQYQFALDSLLIFIFKVSKMEI